MGLARQVFGDLWYFDLGRQKWVEVEAEGAEGMSTLRGPRLLPRMGHSFVASPDKSLFLVGGMGDDEDPMDRWMDRWMDVWMDGWIDGWMYGCMDGWMDRWMDG
eukprot:1050934-Prorocentrum_minimum.AAC.1